MQRFDQAHRLREAIIKKEKIEPERVIAIDGPQVICVSSGKGGVGKSNFTINLAIALQSSGKRVIVIDADLGLANVEILLGLMPKYSLLDIIKQDIDIKEIIAQGPLGIGIISGGSGIQEMTDLSLYDMNLMLNGINKLKEMADYILIDTGAGISKSVTSFIEASKELIVVTTCEPTSIADAYALIKIISLNEKDKKINIVVNRAENITEAKNVFLKLEMVSKKFLDLNLNFLGSILDDPAVPKAVKSQKPFITDYPKSNAAICIRNISSKITDTPVEDTGFTGFMSKLKGIFASGGKR